MDSTSVEFNAQKRRVRNRRFRINFSGIKEYAKRNRKILSVVAVAVFLFYWFEMRPIQINHSCANQASSNARSLLQSKAQITTDASKKASYNALAEKGMYLRSDYESFYTKCLRSHGKNM